MNVMKLEIEQALAAHRSFDDFSPSMLNNIALPPALEFLYVPMTALISVVQSFFSDRCVFVVSWLVNTPIETLGKLKIPDSVATVYGPGHSIVRGKIPV